MSTTITQAMERAARRRLPLVIVVLPKSPADQETLRNQGLQLQRLRPMVVLHEVVDGSTDAAQLSAASGESSVPRCHIFPPQARQLPRLDLKGDGLTAAALRSAALRAAAFTAAEIKGFGDQSDAAEAALAGYLRANPAKKAETPAPKPQDSAPKPPQNPAPKPVAEKPAASTVASPPAATMKVRVLRGSEAEVVAVPGMRKNMSMTFMRRVVAKALGHEHFSLLSAKGDPLTTSQLERCIVGDVLGPDGCPTVKLSPARVALEEARKSSGAAESNAAESPAPLAVPSPTKGPRSEPAADVSVEVAMPAGRPVAFAGPAESKASGLWSAVVARAGVPEARLSIQARPPNADDDANASSKNLTGEDFAAMTLAELAAAGTLAATVAPEARHVDPLAAAADDAASPTIRVRLSYPGVKETPVVTASPSDPLQVLFDRAAQDLNTRNISLVQAYPPRRFKPDELGATFESLGIKGSVAVRVVAEQPQNDEPQQASSSGIAGGLSRLVGGLFGRGQQAAAPDDGESEEDSDAPRNAPNRPPAAARQPARSLGEIARREAEEREAKNRREGKNNTYFGGDSTAFEGK